MLDTAARGLSAPSSFAPGSFAPGSFAPGSLGACAVGLLTLLLTLALSSPLAAQDTSSEAPTMAEGTAREQDLTDQRARAHFTVGRAMYDAGRFSDAASEFQQAYDLSHRPQLLYNLYVAYRDSSQLVRARDALRAYLAEVADIPNRLHLVSRLEALEAQVAEEERARQDLVNAETAAANAEAERARVELERQRVETENRHLRRQRPWWPWLLVGVGAAAIGTGIGLGVDAGSRADALRDGCRDPLTGEIACPSGPLQPVRPLEGVPGIQEQAAIADGLWAGGAAIAAAGLVLAFALNDDISVDASDEPQAPTVSAGCTNTGCMAFVQGEF